MVKLKLAKLGEKPEIFHTLQGEGVSMGLPSVFVRSSLCNLHCVWCDTPYTWNWEKTPWQHQDSKKYSKQESILELSIEQVVEQITSYSCTNIIFTGGEPLLQQEAWIALMQKLRGQDASYRFEVETNGTVVPEPYLTENVAQWNVSAKLSNSNNPETLRIKPEAIHYFTQQQNAYFKFVIQDEADLAEVHELIRTYHLPQHQILLMPEGTSEAILQTRRQWLADICRDQHFRYSDRLHIQLWGSKRGV